jgi:hypothetical protein
MRWAIRLKLLSLVVVMAAVMAQPAEPVTLSDADLTRLVASSRSEILIKTSLFDQRALAEGYRTAVVERGTRGFVLVTANTAQIPASYAPWASLLPNSQVRLLSHTRHSYIVIDRRIAVVIQERMGLPVWIVKEDPVKVRELVRQFLAAYHTAVPYNLEPAVREMLRQRGR